MCWPGGSDAGKALVVARTYRQHCYIGRRNEGANRDQYITEYWADPVTAAPSLSSPDCVDYDPAVLRFVWLADGGLQLRSGSIDLIHTANDADARDALVL